MKQQGDRLHSGNRVGIPRARARFLTQARALEERDAPGVVSIGVFLSLTLFIGAIVWASVTELSEIASTPGEVVPAGLVQKVQHIDGGLVKDILVSNGDTVVRDQVLVRLEPSMVESELEQLASRRVALKLDRTRVDALLGGHEPDFSNFLSIHASLVQTEEWLFDDQADSQREQLELADAVIEQKLSEAQALIGQIVALEEQIVLLEELEEMESQLAAQQVVARKDMINVAVRLSDSHRTLSELLGRQSVAKRGLMQAQQSRRELASRLREQWSLERSQVSTELAEVEQSIVRAEQRLERLVLRSPVNGIVNGLAVNTLNEVINPGQMIMEIVPTAKALQVESRVSTTDIGHVHVGQGVDVQVTSYESTRFGTVSGTVRSLSASTYLDVNQSPYYRAEIELAKDHLGAAPGQHQIIPGMTVQADIITGKKTVLDYILKPVYRGFQTSMRER